MRGVGNERKILIPLSLYILELKISAKLILTKYTDFDSGLWLSRRCVFSWSYQASVHLIILRASNSQGWGLGLVSFKCPFNGTFYDFITFFPCYSCFSLKTRDFAGYSSSCADKCIFAYCLDIWMILIDWKLNLYNHC